MSLKSTRFAGSWVFDGLGRGGTASCPGEAIRETIRKRCWAASFSGPSSMKRALFEEL
jgi:hypothetical protein